MTQPTKEKLTSPSQATIIRRLIVTTCGTSLLTNTADGALRRCITDYANARGPDEAGAHAEAIVAHIAHCQQRLETMNSIAEICKVSAELNGLIKLYGGQFPHGPDHNVLLVTDTWFGSEMGRLIESWLRHKGQASVEIQPLKDLRTDSLAEFRVAMSELVRWCAETLPAYRSQQWRVIFNLTGGFKSVQGFLQTLALFYADEAVYVFQSSGELLRLPRLPVRMEAEQTLRDHLTAFRRMARGLTVSSNAAETIPDTLRWIDGGQATLSPWGELVWDQGHRELYRERLWDPASPRLRYGPRFAETTQGLPAERMELINERIDDLAVYLEMDKPLARLDFKDLKDNPRSPSTHECDAWHDRDTRRLFGHHEGNVFVLDALAKALH